MNRQIEWEDVITSFTGRNGNFKCIGIDLVAYDGNKRTVIHPITSKHQIGNCNITIPTENIPEIIKTLKEIVKNQKDGGRS